jgi:hypothetical protein
LIWQYLQNDIDDDWFQDPIRYKDFEILSDEAVFFEDNIHTHFGRYQASEKEIFHLPKGDFTLRYALETGYYDRFMYINLVLPLMQLFDPLLNKRVYSHRYCGDGKHLFLSHIHQWEKFKGIIRSEANDKCVLVTDIQNFYENIRLVLLKKDLEDLLQSSRPNTVNLVKTRFIIDRLMECLEKWSYDGERGLPQNRDCSSFLANIYMHKIDKIIIESGYEYYRYMDDICIICDDNFHARRALKDLVVNLRDKHLSLNGKKTRKIKPRSEEHTEILKPKTDLKRIDSLLNTKKEANVAIGFQLLKEQSIALIKAGKFEDREFRFCINRLSKLARCRDYKVPKGFWNDIAKDLVHAIFVCPTCTDRIFLFLASIGLNNNSAASIVSYICDPKRSIYEWQNYWLWKLLIICKVTDSGACERARQLLKNDAPIPDKAGAILYLAEFGTRTDKVNIMLSIKTEDSIFLQRHKWLACKGLDWIRDDVQKKRSQIHRCLRGTYRVINDNIKVIVSPPPPTRLSEILMSVHQYD